VGWCGPALRKHRPVHQLGICREIGWCACGTALKLPPPPLPADPPDMVKLHAQHGPLFWWRFLGRRMLMVATYDACKKVLMSEGTYGELGRRRPASVTHQHAAGVGAWQAWAPHLAVLCAAAVQSRLTIPRA
jgi:hypothetical protein